MSETRAAVKRWTWRISKVVLAGAVIAGIVYWVRFAPVAVESHRIGQGEIVADVMGTGTLEARVQANVSSKISGRISDVLVDQGDKIKQKQLLVRLDDEELRQQVAIAQADREAAEAAIERLKTDKERALAVAAQARSSYQRTQSLAERKVATQEDLERATEAVAVAEADVSRAEAAITEGRKELNTAEKTLEYHRARLADTEIKAPFDGLIVRRERDPGDVVVPGSSIMTLISTDELWISSWVDETMMARVAENQPAGVVFRSEPERSYPGHVVRLGREADRETREFVVDVRVHELPDNWAVGQRAEVYIETDRKESVVRLPVQYLVSRGERTGAYTLRNNRARWQPLTLGLRSREFVEVTDGLTEGDVVLRPADPRDRLSDKQQVELP
jgi:multidrug resistance efflux pump